MTTGVNESEVIHCIACVVVTYCIR